MHLELNRHSEVKARSFGQMSDRSVMDAIAPTRAARTRRRSGLAEGGDEHMPVIGLPASYVLPNRLQRVDDFLGRQVHSPDSRSQHGRR